MTSHQVELLAPFGTTSEERWFRTAYRWKRDQIFGWMKTIAEAGGVPPRDDAAVKRFMMDLYNYIISLSVPDGSRYKAPAPPSHIYRRVNPDFQRDRTSKFLVVGWTIRPSIDPSMQGRKPGWWCPYDLLGLFLSLLGPAPDGANKNNFYLPLTAVYARWCSRIAGRPFPNWKWKIPNREQGQGDFPAVFQCTWHTTVNEETKQRSGHYFLGASTAGDKFPKTPEGLPGPWREKVQEARFTMLFNCQNVTMVQQDDFINKTAPNQRPDNPNRNMVPWGNCAETYPFATMFFGEKKKNELMEGLALKRDFMKEGEHPEYNPSITSGQVIDPCANCKKLIENAGGKVANFRKTPR